MFQHTAARRRLPSSSASVNSNHISFNTQPPEGGCVITCSNIGGIRSFNTQPPEGGCLPRAHPFNKLLWFQHTAARRRLLARTLIFIDGDDVSTHSRPKAAAANVASWLTAWPFQHTAARRRLPDYRQNFKNN